MALLYFDGFPLLAALDTPNSTRTVVCSPAMDLPACIHAMLC
jgi:hypothetical protein